MSAMASIAFRTTWAVSTLSWNVSDLPLIDHLLQAAHLENSSTLRSKIPHADLRDKTLARCKYRSEWLGFWSVCCDRKRETKVCCMNRKIQMMEKNGKKGTASWCSFLLSLWCVRVCVTNMTGKMDIRLHITLDHKAHLMRDDNSWHSPQ